MKPVSPRQRTKSTTNKIRKGDNVIAITGNYKGHTGKVLSCEGETAVVQGINVRKRHVRKSQMNPQGRIVEVERPVHISNLKACSQEGQPVKLRVRVNKDGEREFFYKDQQGNEVFYRSLKKQQS